MELCALWPFGGAGGLKSDAVVYCLCFADAAFGASLSCAHHREERPGQLVGRNVLRLAALLQQNDELQISRCAFNRDGGRPLGGAGTGYAGKKASQGCDPLMKTDRPRIIQVSWAFVILMSC